MPRPADAVRSAWRYLMTTLSRHPEDMRYARKSLAVGPFITLLVVAVIAFLIVLNAID
jgi:hypothetical protein